MSRISKAIGIAALAATLVPPLLFAGGWMPLEHVKTVLAIASVAWFVTAPQWMRTD